MTDDLVAEKGNWDDFELNNNNGDNGSGDLRKARYITFKKAGDYKVRLVGSHVKFRRHWQPFAKGARIITHPSYKDDDPAWAAGFYPKETFAIHVIDRRDGELKILEKGKSVFGAFAEYKRLSGVDPAGKEGPDFNIKVDIKDPEDLRSTSYTVTPLGGPTPLTDDEIKMAKDNVWPLNKMYKSTPLDKIKEEWEKVPEDKRTPPKRESKDEKSKDEKSKDEKSKDEKSGASSEAKPDAKIEESETASEGDDDLFGDNSGGDEGEDSTDLF